MNVEDLDLESARALVRRAVEKAEQLGLSGGIVVVGASGALITGSRMDDGGAGGMGRARSKAWIAATQRIPSTEHLHRLGVIAPAVAAGFPVVSPESAFPGAGGMPIRKDGRIVAGIAASGSTVSPFIPAGVEPEVMIADGKPANPEDLLIAYALGQPYVGQHGDDLARWTNAFGPWPDEPPVGLGTADAPASSRQPDLDWARGLADAVIARAATQDLAVSVCVVDRRGEPMQHDAMDDAPDQRCVRRRGRRGGRSAVPRAQRRPGRADPRRRPRAARARLCPLRWTARECRRADRGGSRRRWTRAVPLRGARGRRPGGPSVTVRVCVVGCGAIGSLYAAHLARLDDVEAWAVDPYGAHVDAINERGLTVVSRLGPGGPHTSTTEGGRNHLHVAGPCDDEPRRRTPLRLRHRRHQGRAHAAGRGGLRRGLR